MRRRTLRDPEARALCCYSGMIEGLSSKIELSQFEFLLPEGHLGDHLYIF